MHPDLTWARAAFQANQIGVVSKLTEFNYVQYYSFLSFNRVLQFYLTDFDSI